jgi:hypothetical protein
LRKARHCPYTSRPMNTSTRSRRESSRQASSLRRSMMSMPGRPRSAEDGV